MVLLQGAIGLNTGDIIATAIILFGIPIFLGIVIFITYKIIGKRGNARLALEQERTLQLQKQVDELNQRVAKMEQLLREGENK